jgi:hypothetical protein
MILKLIYYLISLPVLLHEHNRLLSGKSDTKQLKSEVELLSDMNKKGGTLGSMNGAEKSIAKSILYKILFQITYIIWVVVGLMTFNWWIFTIILLMSQIPKKSTVAVRLDAALTIIMVVFAILNTYVYKIDVTFYIKTWLGLF